MKFLASQLAYLVARREVSGNMRALIRYFLFLAFLVTCFAVVFHLIMVHCEHQEHSWVTGFYWTLVVMTTLGFGDITFATDVGRVFSMLVMISGVVFLMVMLPFLFIRLFYAPWLETQLRLRAPREVPAKTSGHVVVALHDPIAAGLVRRLRAEGIPCFVVEPDPARAVALLEAGTAAVTGDNDDRATYERMRVEAARLVLANGTDAANTNITLTVRELHPQVPIVALAEDQDSVDILELSGATAVLPLKKQLGEYLANRVHAGIVEAHLVGILGDLRIAELPARATSFVGQTIRETRLREETGLSVVGLWERGQLRPAYPDARVAPGNVLVLSGSEAQLKEFSNSLPGRGRRSGAVLLLGMGKVGRAAARSLKNRGIPVHAIDRNANVLARVAPEVTQAFEGNAADRRVLERAGLKEASSVLLTTNDDATNIYLAVYCRRLNPEVRIVSRITHERNVEAIHRAGADFALGYTTLGVEAIVSRLHGYEPVLLGEAVKLFSVDVPQTMAGRPLRESGIGSRTGLSVMAIRQDGNFVPDLNPDTLLPEGGELLMLGSLQQRQIFNETFL
jgi:Trk K+ transport system NAD-binding subunit